MEPLKRDLTWYRNAPQAGRFRLAVDGAPYDLTGFTFKMQARLYPGAVGLPLFTLAMAAEGEPGFFLDDPETGAFTMTPPSVEALSELPGPADVTSGINRSASYDILIIAPDGKVEVFAEGSLILLSGVTRQ